MRNHFLVSVTDRIPAAAQDVLSRDRLSIMETDIVSQSVFVHFANKQIMLEMKTE